MAMFGLAALTSSDLSTALFAPLYALRSPPCMEVSL